MTSTPESPDVTPAQPDALDAPDAAVTEEPAAESVELPEPDPRLVAAHDLALAALHEITARSSVGPAAGYTPEPGGAVSLRFENRLAGYPGWYWTVSVAVVEGAEPTVLEAELLPGAGALLAPEWVPWATRLAEYHAQQALLAETADDATDDDAADEDETDDLDTEDLDDVDDLDAGDFDQDGSTILHAGDVDGVDIDELYEDADDSDDEDVSDDDDSEDDSDEDDSDEDEDDSDEDVSDDEDDSDEDVSDDEDDRR